MQPAIVPKHLFRNVDDHLEVQLGLLLVSLVFGSIASQMTGFGESIR
jgi:hypothetical protein